MATPTRGEVASRAGARFKSKKRLHKCDTVKEANRTKRDLAADA